MRSKDLGDNVRLDVDFYFFVEGVESVVLPLVARLVWVYLPKSVNLMEMNQCSSLAPIKGSRHRCRRTPCTRQTVQVSHTLSCRDVLNGTSRHGLGPRRSSQVAKLAVRAVCARTTPQRE